MTSVNPKEKLKRFKEAAWTVLEVPLVFASALVLLFVIVRVVSDPPPDWTQARGVFVYSYIGWSLRYWLKELMERHLGRGNSNGGDLAPVNPKEKLKRFKEAADKALEIPLVSASSLALFFVIVHVVRDPSPDWTLTRGWLVGWYIAWSLRYWGKKLLERHLGLGNSNGGDST